MGVFLNPHFVTPGLVPGVHDDLDRRNKCGDDGIRSVVNREPRSGVAIQTRPLDCFVGSASSRCLMFF